MMRGARSIYVDYVDYDEIAHHAGPPGSSPWRRSADSTRWWRSWRRWRSGPPAATTSSCSATTASRRASPSPRSYGIDLSDLCRSLTTRRRPASRAASRAGAGSTRSWRTSVGPARPACRGGLAARRQKSSSPRGRRGGGRAIVLAGGNLGLVYVPGPERLLLEEVEARWPALVPGLVAHPGVGFVGALSSTGPVAIGSTAAATSRPVWSRVSTRCSRSGTTRPPCWRRPP